MVVDLRGVGGRRRARCLEGRRSCQKAWLPSRGVASRRGLSRRSCARGLAGAPPAYFWSCTHAADSWSSRRRRLRLGSARDGWEREMPAVEPRPLLLVLWERRSHRGRREGRRRETGVGVKGRGEGERSKSSGEMRGEGPVLDTAVLRALLSTAREYILDRSQRCPIPQRRPPFGHRASRGAPPQPAGPSERASGHGASRGTSVVLRRREDRRCRHSSRDACKRSLSFSIYGRQTDLS